MARAPTVGDLIAAAEAGSLAAIGHAPAASMAMLDVSMAGSLGMAMANAVANQQRGQVIAQAALAQTLALILIKGANPCPKVA